MPWSRPTLTEIYERIRADGETRVTSGVKIPRVSLLGIIYLVFTGAIHLSYGFLVWLAKQLFVDTAETIGLDRWANILGLPRKAATFTTGTVTFVGTVSKVIEAGTLVQNSDGFQYATDEILTISILTTATGTVTATDDGEDSNTEDNFLTLVYPDVDINTSVTVVSGFDDGQAEETDEDLTIRLLQRFQNPPSSGTLGDYVRWALEVDGVGKAWSFGAEDWAGAGTVGVGVADSNLEPVSGSILTAVETYVDSVKPEPAAVDYFNITDVVIDFEISISPNTTANQTLVEANLEELFLSTSSPGGTIKITNINQAIISGGLNDFEITAMEQDSVPISIANIVNTGTDTARYGSTTFASL